MAEAFVVKVENGVARLYRKNGEFDRVICGGALNAKVKEDEIIVQMQGGKKKVYSVRGFFIRNS
jgi:hypothetical protein